MKENKLKRSLEEIMSLEKFDDLMLNDNDLLVIKGGNSQSGAIAGLGCGMGCGSGCYGCTSSGNGGSSSGGGLATYPGTGTIVSPGTSTGTITSPGTGGSYVGQSSRG